MYKRCSLGVAALALVALGTVPSSVRAADEPGAVNLAHIKLTGNLDETPLPDDPLFALGQENFKSKLDRIQKAKKDAAIKGLYLQIEGLHVGWGKLDELRHALADFRGAGKKVYAFLEMGDMKDYLLASACDEICMPEAGWLVVTGLRGEVTFYKDLLGKIGIQADMLQMGDYKGAAEPLTRNKMSPEFRKQLESVLDDYFEKSIVETIVKDRKGKGLAADQVKKVIDQGPYTAKAAQAAGLIDRVGYADQFKDAIRKEQKAENVNIRKDYGQDKPKLDFSNPFAIFQLLAPPSTRSSNKPKVAVIYATGVIITGKSGETLFGGHTTGSTTMVQAIRKAADDDTVKAIVLRVDSPGGSALASDLIWNELRRCQKPVIASMGDVAASGGYYISMGARKIFAEPGTLTGSIGVVGGKLVMGELEKMIGLNTEVIQRGANAGLFSTTTPFSESERKALTTLMKDIYDQFLDKALLGRETAGKKITRDGLTKLAEGRLWTGRQAKANGLIDELGTLDDAIAAAKEMAGVGKEDLELLILPKQKGFLDQLIESRSDTEMARPEIRLSLLRDLPRLENHLRQLGGMVQLHGEPVWAIVPHRIEVK